MTDDDPLDGADIGDTATIRETTDIWVGGLEADATEGSDRMADSEVVDTAVVTDEYGDQHLRVTVESDVTKRLPRRWDAAREPRTDSERRQSRRETWISRGITATVTAVTLGLGLVVTNSVMKRAARGMTVNGEPLTYSPWDLVPVVAIVVLAVAVVRAMVHGPRMGQGGAR